MCNWLRRARLIIAATAIAAIVVATLHQDVFAEQVFVPGTTLGLTPPPGFVLAEDFAGFRNPRSGGRILVIEYPASFFTHVKAGMENGTAVPKGVEVTSTKPIRIDTADGMMLRGRQTLRDGPANVWMLLLGGKAATIILAVTESEKGSLDDDAVASLFSDVRLRARPSLKTQLSRLPFEFGQLAGFEVWRTALGTMALLSQSPASPPNPKSNPMLIVSSRASGLSEDIDSRALAALALRAEPGIAFDPVKTARRATVAGGDGYEAIALGTDRRTNLDVRAKVWFRLLRGRLLTAICLIDPETDDRVLVQMGRVVATIRAE